MVLLSHYKLRAQQRVSKLLKNSTVGYAGEVCEKIEHCTHGYNNFCKTIWKSANNLFDYPPTSPVIKNY